MPRKLLALSIASGLCALNAHALEWDDAYKVASAGVFYAAQPSDSSYPSSFGLGLTGAYHLPLFVEGHHKVIAQGHYGFYRPRPEAKVGMRGASNHELAAQVLVMFDADVMSRTVWWGAGISRHATYSYNRYQWAIDQGKWTLNEFDNSWFYGSNLLFSAHYPISRELSLQSLLQFSISDNTPHYINFKLGYRF